MAMTLPKSPNAIAQPVRRNAWGQILTYDIVTSHRCSTLDLQPESAIVLTVLVPGCLLGRIPSSRRQPYLVSTAICVCPQPHA